MSNTAPDNQSNKEDLGENLKNIFTAMISSSNKEAEKTALFKELLENPKVFNSAETFYLFNIYPINKVVNRAVEVIKQPSPENAHKASLIYLHHNYFNYHLRYIFEEYEGSACCADKSKAIVSQYLHFVLTGEYREWNADSEKCYWLPRFGTQRDWFDLMDALVAFHYGKPAAYIEQYAKIKALGEKRKSEIQEERNHGE